MSLKTLMMTGTMMTGTMTKLRLGTRFLYIEVQVALAQTQP